MYDFQICVYACSKYILISISFIMAVVLTHVSSSFLKANFSHWYRDNSDEKVVGENVEDVVEDNLKNNVSPVTYDLFS